MEAKNKNSKKVRLVGSIVEDVLQGWNRSTELCCDVKTILHSDRTLKTGKDYQGVLRRDHDADIDEFRCRDAHYTFVETVAWTEKRNPRVFRGKYITITRRPDGTLRPNFRPMPTDMTIDHYTFKVYCELRKALEGLIEK